MWKLHQFCKNFVENYKYTSTVFPKINGVLVVYVTSDGSHDEYFVDFDSLFFFLRFDYPD